MDMMAPPETLSSIAKLVASSPTPAAISHELSLLHQRTFSLLSLQQTLRAFSTRREGLTSLQASYSEVVERAIAEEEGKTNSTSPPSDSSQGGGRRLGVKDAEIRFRDAYADALDTFERGWEGQSQVFAQWELLPSLVMVESPPRPTFDAPPLPPSNFAIPNSWIYALPDPLNSTPSILRFTSLLLAEPYILGSGISTLEGPSLTSLLPPNNPTSTSSSSQHRASPLKTLFQLSAETRGPLAVLEIAHGIWSTALSELVGREKSDREEGGNGGGERVKELENFLVGVLDVLDSLGLEVEVDGGTGAVNSQHDASSRGSGPLGLHRGVEEVLLQLLKDAPTVRANSKSEPETPSPPPSTWGSTVTSTFSTLVNISTSGLYSVASISGAGLSTVANAASMGFLPLASVTPPPPSPSPSPNPTSAPSKSIIASPNFQNRASSISTPSKILHPALLSQDPLAVLLSRSATSLLKLFTPSPRDSSATPKPLIEVLLSRLLSYSFPSNTSPSENRKVLLLGLIRWWCFSFLGRKIGQAGSGGGWTTPHIPFGVVLDGEGGIDFGAGKREETLLDEVHVGRKDAVELFLGLHRVVYAAMVDACGFGTSKEVGADREARALAKAARSLVAAWSSGGAPTSPPKPTKEIHAFLLGPGEFSTLVLSFGPLILRSHVPTLPKRNGGAGGARPMSVSPSFKRSPAFVNRESKRVKPGVGARYSLDRQDEEEGMDEMLSDQLDIVLADVFSLSNRGQALLFAIPPDGSSSSLQITTRIPDDHLSHSPPPPAAPASSIFPSRLPPNSSFAFPNPPSNSNNFNKGWDSPPGSPRQEALQSSLQDQGSNFSQRPIQQQGIDIPEDDIPPFSKLLGTSLLWRSTSNPKATPQQAPARPVLSSPEVALLRKGIFALIRSGYVATRQGETGSDVFQEGKSHLVIDCLTSAARRSAEERQYHSHLLYSQCLSILRHHQIVGGTNMDFVLNRVAAPLRESYDKSCAILLRTQRRLDEIEGQRRRLLDLARVLRGEIDDAVRIRAWYTSFKASNLGRQFRARLSEAISPNRSPEERERALKKVENWQRELGIYSFARATDSPFEHALMLVETVVHLAIRPQVFYSNPLWSREKAVVDSLVAVSRSNQQRHAQDYRPSFAETLIGAGSAILTAPLSLAGLPYSSSTNPPASTSPLPRNVMLSFGASSPSMLKPHEQNTAFSGAVEEHLLRIGLKLSGYLWSDISSTFILNRDVDGRLVGCDSWIEEFSSPLSPLVRPPSSEIPPGANPLPKAFIPTTPPPPHYYKKLLDRFILHPSPNAKIHALLELELVLTAELGSPSSARSKATTGNSAATSKARRSERGEEARSTHTRARSYLTKLSGLLSKRLSLAPSPIAKLLEGEAEEEATGKEGGGEGRRTTEDLATLETAFGQAEEGEEEEEGGERASLSSSHNVPPQSPTSPRRPPRQVSIMSDSTFDDPTIPLHPLLFLSLSLDSNPPPKPSQEGVSPSTDTLLVSLEDILKHYRPSQLFQSLQIIASLTPSAVLDSQLKGKAFWDVGLAALSIKRDIVEGEFGIVERALAALGDGTEEGTELASRLLEIGAKEEASVALEMINSIRTSTDSSD